MFSNYVKGLFVVLGAGLPLGIFVLERLVLYSSASDAMKDRYHAVAAETLVPMFTAVAAALFTAGIIKGILTLRENTQLIAKGQTPHEIKFFNW